MCKRIFSKKISIIFLLTFLFTPAYAEEFIISSSQESVEKGEIFDLYLEIRTDETAIENLKIDHQFPRGFTLESRPNPKFSAKDIINPGSSITISYRVSAPPHTLIPFTGERGISTRDRKRFIFNISYTRKPEGQIRQRQIEYFLRYTTSMYIYLFWAMIGLLVAHIIKSLAKSRSNSKRQNAKIKDLLNRIFSENFVGLMTTLLIGFGVLIILAQEMVPTRGWYDTLALGIILGMIGDENLLRKLKGP